MADLSNNLDAAYRKEARRRAGLARVRAAMEHVESAQNELMRACRDLSAVIGFSPEFEAVYKLHDRVKATWYRLEASLGKRGVNVGELDGNSTLGDGNPRPDEHPHAGCAGYGGSDGR